MLQRWSKLERDFRNKSGRYDISKIPDIYDCVKYDTQHNSTLDLEDTLELFRLSRALADIIIPQVREGGKEGWSGWMEWMEWRDGWVDGCLERWMDGYSGAVQIVTSPR